MSEEEADDMSFTGKSFILGKLGLKFFFKQSMNMLFSSIIVLQIISHLPLAEINLPANALQQFNIMIEIVSFDYF